MLGILVLIVIVIVLVVMIFRPKLGILLLWPMLFLYPHYYMWQRQLLPLNIGIDDLFICAMFLIVLVRQNLMGGMRPRFGYAFWITFVFFIISLISNVNSYLLVGVELEEFVKAILKGVITVLLAYSLINSIDDLDDLKRLVFAYCFSAGLGAVIMILQQFFPGPFIIFTSPYYVFGLEHGARPVPVGAFMNRNNAAIVLGTASLVIVSTLGLRSMYFRKSLRFTLLGIMVVAILFTRSRSGFLCLVIPLMLMGFVGKNKGYAMIFIIIGLIVFLALPTFRGALFERFGIGGPGGEYVGFWNPIIMRLQAVLGAWERMTLRRLLFGQSQIVDIMFGYPTAHNAYFGIPLTYGFGGAIWMVALIAIMLHKAKLMTRHPDLTISSVGRSIRWCLVVFGLYCIVGGLIGNYYVRYSLFLLAVLAQRGADLAWQYQLWDYDELYMDNPDSIALGEGYMGANCSEIDSNGCPLEG